MKRNVPGRDFPLQSISVKRFAEQYGIRFCDGTRIGPNARHRPISYTGEPECPLCSTFDLVERVLHLELRDPDTREQLPELSADREYEQKIGGTE